MVEQKEPSNPLTDQIVGSPLSDLLVLAHMKAGNIIIDPFISENLKGSSYDIRLGEWYFEEQRPRFRNAFFNPYSPDHVKKVWGEPNHAAKARLLMKEFGSEIDWTGIEKDDAVIMLEPGYTYLCHSMEYIGFKRLGTTMMKARSTLGRDHIEVCKCAGWGDPGFYNRWTMEVTNNSQHYHIPLVVGTRVAQIVFFFTGETTKDYTSYGVYQSVDDLLELKKNWKPEDMLPKLRK